MAKMQVKTQESLAVAQANYIQQVDVIAERFRAAIITASPGQAMTYEAKHREAQEYPNRVAYPFLQQEADTLGLTLEAVAQSVLDARAQWELFGAGIEAARLKAKREIRAANTVLEMHNAVQRLTSYLEGS